MAEDQVAVLGMGCGICGRGETVSCPSLGDLEQAGGALLARGWRYTPTGGVRCPNCPDDTPSAGLAEPHQGRLL